jgi:hypothetical protein
MEILITGSYALFLLHRVLREFKRGLVEYWCLVRHFYRMPCSETRHKSLNHGGLTTCVRDEMLIASDSGIRIMSVAQERVLPVSKFRLR